MKGFALSPLLFVGLFTIAGLMIIGFSDLDRRMGIGTERETGIRKLNSLYIEDKTSAESRLYLYSIQAISGAANHIQLINNITNLMGSQVYLLDCRPAYFSVSYNKTFVKAQGDSAINIGYNIAKNITCQDIYGLRMAPNPISIQCETGQFSCTAQT